MFTGIPNFAPEMFRRVVLRDPLRMKALQKGLDQLCEEGATQVFRPLRNNDLILGAVGMLQFDVVAFRLQDEYGVQATWDNVNVLHGALGVLRATRRSSRSSAPRPTTTSRSITRGRWSTWRRRASTCSSRSSAGPTSRSGRPVSSLAARRVASCDARPVVAWAFYDWANSAFATTVMAGFFPVFFKQYWNAGVDRDREHLPARHRQRHRRPVHRAAGAGARRHRRPRRRRKSHADGVHACSAAPPPPALALVRQGHWVAAAALFIAGVARLLGRHRVQRLAAAARRGAGRLRPRVRLRLRARLPRRRPAVRGQRADDAEAAVVRARGRGRGRARVVRDGRRLVARVRAAAARCSCTSSAAAGRACRWPGRAPGLAASCAARCASLRATGRCCGSSPRTGCTSTA